MSAPTGVNEEVTSDSITPDSLESGTAKRKGKHRVAHIPHSLK